MISRAYAGLLTGFGLLAGVAFAVVAALVTLNVLLRNLGVANFPWLLEVTEYVLYIGTFLAAPWVLRLGAHVRVDLLPGLLPAAGARLVNTAADLCGLVFSLILARHGLNVTADAFSRGDRIFKELVIPEWPLLATIPLAAALLAIEFARRIRYPGPSPGRDGGKSDPPSDGL
jgi:TRAP-type C4-dicarboxylate transport system permease small subunit